MRPLPDLIHGLPHPAACLQVALNSYWLPFVEYKALFYWWLQVALGVATAALVSMFVAPLTAGGWVGGWVRSWACAVAAGHTLFRSGRQAVQ